MNRDEVAELHYITAVKNVPSILDKGILSHARTTRMAHTSVADPEVQARRAERWIPGGLRLHEYANLYFNARNAMLFRILRHEDLNKRVPAEEMTVLRVAPTVLDLPRVVVTDINAAADVAPRWHTPDDGIARLVHDELFAQYWNSYEHRQRMMAEVLVPHNVPTDRILGSWVVSDQAAAFLYQVAPTLAVEVNPYMFFRGPKP